MKNLFAQTMACISLVAVMSVSINVYSQKTDKQEGSTHSYNEALLGKWKVDNGEYTFDKSGTSVVVIDGRECPGTWILHGETLTINPRKLKWRKDDPCSKTRVFHVVSVNNDMLIVTERQGQKKLHLTRQ